MAFFLRQTPWSTPTPFHEILLFSTTSSLSKTSPSEDPLPKISFPAHGVTFPKTEQAFGERVVSCELFFCGFPLLPPSSEEELPWGLSSNQGSLFPFDRVQSILRSPRQTSQKDAPFFPVPVCDNLSLGNVWGHLPPFPLRSHPPPCPPLELIRN